MFPPAAGAAVAGSVVEENIRTFLRSRDSPRQKRSGLPAATSGGLGAFSAPTVIFFSRSSDCAVAIPPRPLYNVARGGRLVRQGTVHVCTTGGRACGDASDESARQVVDGTVANHDRASSLRAPNRGKAGRGRNTLRGRQPLPLPLSARSLATATPPRARCRSPLHTHTQHCTRGVRGADMQKKLQH